MALLLGCIADDFTGATDLASTLVLTACGRPGDRRARGQELPADADAIVVALKSRTVPVEEAVANRLPPANG